MIDDMYQFLANHGFNEPLHSPVTHMPMGLVIGALIFFIFAIILKKKELIVTARHVSILAFIFAFPTILLGVIDWIHYYHAALFTPIKIKMVLAVIVLVVLGAGIILGSEIKIHSVTLAILYSIAFLAVIGLGYYGAGIIYGRGVELKVSSMKTNNSVEAYDPEKLGIEEKLGNYVPLDLAFVNENGASVKLKDVIKEPTILSIVYYKCPNACDYLLTGISSALRSYTDKPGTEPNLLTVTIDERETTVDAMAAKKIAFESIEKPYPADKWHFLTGKEESIKKLTGAVGFHYIKNGDDFDHPIGLIILSGDGKVVRYIMGTDFLPMDLKISLMQASKGVVTPTIARVLRFCFSYNPKSHQFIFNTLRVSATVIFILIAGFIIFLIITGKKRQNRGVK